MIVTTAPGPSWRKVTVPSEKVPRELRIFAVARRISPKNWQKNVYFRLKIRPEPEVKSKIQTKMQMAANLTSIKNSRKLCETVEVVGFFFFLNVKSVQMQKKCEKLLKFVRICSVKCAKCVKSVQMKFRYQNIFKMCSNEVSLPKFA